MKYNPSIHHRRSIRLKGYDYAQAGLYFITICCQDRAHLFGKIKNGKMILNTFGKIAFTEWQNTENIRDNCRIHEFIIMPNHIHGIIEILFKKEKDKEDGKGKKKENNSTGELQFAPTASTATKESSPTKTQKFQSPSQTIGSIIRGYKIATLKRIKNLIQEKDNKEDNSTGELQFAPTAPTALTTEIIKSLNFKIWQRNYYEHIIRTEDAYHHITKYILNNPKKWDEDKQNT